MSESIGAFGEKTGTTVTIQREGVRFNPQLSPEDSDKLDRLTNSLKTLIVEFVSESGLPIRPSEAYSLVADRLAIDAVYLHRMVQEASK